MTKIKVSNPIVEMDGDEMTRVIWTQIKDTFIKPYLDLPIQYFDLSIQNRDATDDKVTTAAANAILQYGVGIKCATITPDEVRVKEFNLKKMWKSPNGTIRNILGGTVFRTPILCKNVPKIVKNWVKPIIIGRHAHADQYRCVDVKIKGQGKVKLVYEGVNQEKQEWEIHNFDSPGICLGMYNTDASIVDFAKACMAFALNIKKPLYLSQKILFSNNTMVDLKIFLKKFLKLNTKKPS